MSTCGKCVWRGKVPQPHSSTLYYGCKCMPPQAVFDGDWGANVHALYPPVSEDTPACGQFVEMDDTPDVLRYT
jgi:hypothetical protein